VAAFGLFMMVAVRPIAARRMPKEQTFDGRHKRLPRRGLARNRTGKSDQSDGGQLAARNRRWVRPEERRVARSMSTIHLTGHVEALIISAPN
jgi:hypothetical protein